MPLFHRVKLPNGRFKMIEVTPVEIADVALETPLSPTLSGPERFTCTLCTPAKTFRAPGIAAMHFAKVHKDQKADPQRTWREFFKVTHGAPTS